MELKKRNSHKKLINLFSAIDAGDSKEVHEILLKNPDLTDDPNCIRIHTDKEGATPLWRAMILGHDEIVDLLIREFNADPDEESLMHNQEFQGRTFLQYTASCDDNFTLKITNVAKNLIKRGANTSLYINSFGSPFRIAVSCGNLPFVELLLNNGTKLPTDPIDCFQLMLNIFDSYNKPQNNRKEMLKLLLKYGLNFNFIDEDDDDYGGQNVLHMFIYNDVDEKDDDAVEIAEILMESAGISPDDPDNINWSPLFYAIQEENLSLVSFFIEQGADVNRQTTDGDGTFPIHNAVELKNFDIAKLLLSNGADVNAQSANGSTALHLACNIYNNEEMVSLLIRWGADMTTEDDYGETCFAVAYGDNEIDKSCVVLIKEFSKLSFKKIPFNASDVNLIRSNLEIRELFESCLTELDLMKKTVFYPPFSYYFVLNKSKNNMKKLALLTKNEEFLAKFKANLNKFSYFQDDLQTILEELVEIKNRLVAVESRLKYIFNDFFPDIVLRKLTDYLTRKHLPLQ